METGSGGRSLRGRWEAFVVRNGSEMTDDIQKEKLQRLEDFLHMFLLMSENSAIDREDLVNFCNDIHSVFNILVRQFMADVQRLASASVPVITPDPPLSPHSPAPGHLMEYLMHGRGWLMLNALCNLAKQALDFNSDFVCLLVKFVEEALNIPVSAKNEDRKIGIPKLEACIQRKNFTKKSLMSIGFAPNMRRLSARRHLMSTSMSSLQSTAASHWSLASRPKASRDRSDSSESDARGNRRTSRRTGSESPQRHVYSRQAPLPPSKTTATGEARIVDWRLPAQSSSSEVDGEDVDALDLSLALLSLLERLCISEAMHPNRRNSLALLLAPKLTQLLTLVNLRSGQARPAGTGDVSADCWTAELLGTLQKLVVRMVVSLCMYSCTQHYEAPKLASSGILFALLQLAKSVGRIQSVPNLIEDIVANTKNQDQGADALKEESPFLRSLASTTDQWLDLSPDDVQYVSEILHGVLLLLIGVMHSCCNNQIVVTHAMALLSEFAANGGYGLVESLLAFVDGRLLSLGETGEGSEVLQDCLVGLLGSLSKLLVATKRAKLEYLHKFQCLKRTHSNCDYTYYTHHHHGIFGLAYGAFEDCRVAKSPLKDPVLVSGGGPLLQAQRSKCCIAVIVEMLLSLLTKARHKSTTVRALFALEQGGICCCLPPKAVVPVFLASLKEQPVAMRSYLLSVLGKLILEQLGGDEQAEGAVEGVCEECAHQGAQSPTSATKDARVPNHYLSSDSAIGSDGSQHDEDVPLTRWHVLELYTPWLMSQDEVLSQQISGHLLHLVRRSNLAVKEELYFNVILSCFHRGGGGGGADAPDGPRDLLPCFSAPSVLEHLFCALPHLLTTLTAQVEFLVGGGLTQLVQLLDLAVTRSHVLNVFKVLVLSEETQGALLPSRHQSNASAISLSEAGDGSSVVQEFAKIVCGVLPFQPPEEKAEVKTAAAGGGAGPEGSEEEPDEDWLQSCEVVEDPLELDVYRSTQNRHVIEEGKAAFAESLTTIREVDEREAEGTFPGHHHHHHLLLLVPDQLSKMSAETLSKAADVWRVADHLLLHSRSFRDQFLQREGEVLARALLTDAMVSLTRTWTMCEGLPIAWPLVSEEGVTFPAAAATAAASTATASTPAPLTTFQVLLDIAGSLLRICLSLQGRTTNGETRSAAEPAFLEVCKGILRQSGIFHSALGRPVAEMLLKVAQSQAYVHPRLQDADHNLKDCENGLGHDMLQWNLEELQEAVSSDSQSEGSDLLTTEGGYEADSEREREGPHTGDCQSLEVSADRSESPLPLHTLLHPSVCRLLLELLEADGPSGGSGCSSDSFPAEVACYSIKQVTAIARSSQASQDGLYRCGLPGVVLQNYRQSVSQAERVLLLDLLAVLVQQNLATSELREILRLFPNSPPAEVNNLLSTLLSIIDSASATPTHILNFPVIGEGLDEARPHSALGSWAPRLQRGEWKQSAPATAAAATPDAGRSPWGVAPVQLPIPGNFAWPPSLAGAACKGFGLTVWLRLDELSLTERSHATFGFRRKKTFVRQATRSAEDLLADELMTGVKRKTIRRESGVRQPPSQRLGLHILSVGSPELTLQAWVDTKTNRMTLRLTHVSSSNDSTLLYETSCANILTLGVWQHFALSYQERLDGSTHNGSVTMTVNGQLCTKVLVEYTNPATCKPSKDSPVPCLLLGHCLPEDTVTGSPHGSWQLGNVLFFNDDRVLTQEVAFHLFSLGPDCATIGACEGSRQGRLYSQHIIQDVLHSGLSTEILCGDREVDLRSTRESLVISYSPSNWDVYSHYEALAQPSSTLGRVLGGASRAYPNALLQCPTSLVARLLCPASPLVQRDLQQAIRDTGGISVFVFLFAKIVESCSDKSIQAKGLRLIFGLRTCSHSLASEFDVSLSASMISQVLVTPNCAVGFEMLKVMLDACLSRPVLYLCSQMGGYRLQGDTTALLRDTGVVSRLLLDWRVWEKAEPGVLALLFRTVETLIRDGHPYRAFNVAQLLSIRCVHSLLMICKERHHEDLPSLSPHSCASVVSIVKGLMGQPPDANLLAEVCDFLLAVHPAVNTFVCHAQSSFYFSQRSLTQKKGRQELLVRTQPEAAASQRPKTSHPSTARFYLPSEDQSSTEVSCNGQQSDASAENAVTASEEEAAGDGVPNMSGLCSGLLHLLADALVGLPGTSLGKVLGIVVKPETLIVLAHHESPLIRTRVIQLLDVYLQRASPSLVEAFLKCRGFHLLANQLHQYPTTKEIMEACLTITVGKPVDMSQGLELLLLQDPDEFQIMSSVLLMSLLENSLHDFNLCHDGICLVNQLFEGVEMIPSVMLTNGLLETLCNILTALLSSAVTTEGARQPDRPSQTLPGAAGCGDKTATAAGGGDSTTDIAADASEGTEGEVRASEGSVPAAFSPLPNGGPGDGAQEGALTSAKSEASLSSASLDPLDDYTVSAIQEAVPRFLGGRTELPETVLILIRDIQHFMACIANRIFSYGNQFERFENMVQMLGGVEEKMKMKHGPNSIIGDVVYETECYIMKEVFDHFKATASSITSAVSKSKKPQLQRSLSYSERKYEEYKMKRRYSADYLSKGLDWGGCFPSVSSLGNSELAMSFIEESSFEDMMSLSSDQDQISDFGQTAEDRRYSAQLDTVLRMQRAQAGPVTSRQTSRRKAPELVSEQVLAKRFQRLCLLTVNLVVQRDPRCMRLHQGAFVTMRGPERFIHPSESMYVRLAKRLFQLLTASLASTMERKTGQRKQWESILWTSRDTLCLQLLRLLVQMAGPWQPVGLRRYMLQVAVVPRAQHILQSLLRSNLQQHLHKLDLFLYNLLHNNLSDLTPADVNLGHQLIGILEKCGFHLQYQEGLTASIQDQADRELWDLMTEESSTQETQANKRLECASSAWTKLEPLAKETSTSAMEVTQLVAAYQNGQRLRFLEFLKSTIASAMDVRGAWQDLIESLTHERAVWYDPQTYPCSWQLDPTEGPGRVRRRLQRCHLNIPAKFLLPQRQENYLYQPPSPLAYLFRDSRYAYNSSEFKRRLQKNEKISCAFFCKLVTPASVNKGDLLRGVNSMYFVSEEPPDSSKTQGNLFERDMLTISWLYQDIKELHLRWYGLRDHALEIFLTNGQTLLLAFETTKERDTLYQQVKACELPNLVEVEDISDVTQAWRHGQMTNYEYLTQLNKLAGRSFNDLMQYPVFPFVLADYTSKVLDLESNESYRDLTRPVAVQTQSMEQRYKENYKFLKEEYHTVKGRMGETMFWTKPYHYGSHYSNSGTVLQYLVRLPPFTKMFLHYQDNHFDLPDRTFHSMDTSWQLSSSKSCTDVKELIPEFFFLPEFLENNEGYNFGVRQSGNPVSEVILPPWAKGSARLFTLIHRQSLESVYVSRLLHTWVDLVFGVKQQGSLAIEAINVFHPATYFGIDTTTIQDAVKRKAVETMVKTYGQTPKQLFVNYHPSRLEPDIFADSFGVGSVGILATLSQRQSPKVNLGPEASSISGPVNTALGMRWGSYVGSASTPDPVLRYQKQEGVVLTTLVPLPTGDVCAMAQHLCLLLMYSKEKGVSSMNAIDIKWSGIVSWGHPDAILRVQVRRKSVPVNLLHATPTDKITCCTSVTDCRLLFIGLECGGIHAYPTHFNPDKQCNVEVVGVMVRLYGHTDRVNSLCVCRPYSILVSASQDGSCIIWDLNRLCYVRSIHPSSDMSGVTALAVSDVSGDIAVAKQSVDGATDLSLWTVNASLVARRLCATGVRCLAFSCAAEGLAVNALVAGCEDGILRFWSTIDFTPIREVPSLARSPIISLTFTMDSQFLLASNQEGKMMVWGSKDTPRRLPKIEVFLAAQTGRSRSGSNSNSNSANNNSNSISLSISNVVRNSMGV